MCLVDLRLLSRQFTFGFLHGRLRFDALVANCLALHELRMFLADSVRVREETDRRHRVRGRCSNLLNLKLLGIEVVPLGEVKGN